MLWITRSAVVFGLSLLAQPQLPDVPSPARCSSGGGGVILEEGAEIPNAEHATAFQH